MLPYYMYASRKVFGETGLDVHVCRSFVICVLKPHALPHKNNNMMTRCLFSI